MLVADVDPHLLRASGALVGAAAGILGGRAADVLPRRYGITHRKTGAARSRRNVAIALASTACSIGIAHVLARAEDVSIAHAAFLLLTNGAIATAVIAAAAIDLEHMILPNELTLGAAVLALATSPLRAIGLSGSLAGAAVGFAVSYVPLLVYKKLRGRTGMGLGDAKLTVTAGAWLGVEGALFVLFGGALQSVLAAVAMRVLGLRYDTPESVKAEIAALRARAAEGDEAARSELADDPMATDAPDGTLAMRLPLGPFLALASIEVLFLRRWLVERVLGWLLE
jgi:leader peptidase (prepilin peptidase)/N-methyltransferase